MSKGFKQNVYDTKIEDQLIGYFLVNGKHFYMVADKLKADDFYGNLNQRVFEVMLKKYNDGKPIDLTTVHASLESVSTLDLADLMTGTMLDFERIEPYSKEILNYSKKRRLVTQVAKTFDELKEGTVDDLEKQIDDLSNSLVVITSEGAEDIKKPEQIIKEQDELFDNLKNITNGVVGIATGFKDLDIITGGLQKDKLYVLAARPSVGKTSLALTFMRNAMRMKKKVVMFSLEMSTSEVMGKLISYETGIPYYTISNGANLSENPLNNQLEEAKRANKRFIEYDFRIIDQGDLNIGRMRTMLKRIWAEMKFDLVIVDYIQLINEDIKDAVQRTSYISRRLKMLAKEFHVPVLALSQLSRAVEYEKPAIPKLAHLRESGAIEQDADVVMFIYREYMDKTLKDTEKKRPIDDATILVEKQRAGALGKFDVKFNMKTTMFYPKPVVEIKKIDKDLWYD